MAAPHTTNITPEFIIEYADRAYQKAHDIPLVEEDGRQIPWDEVPTLSIEQARAHESNNTLRDFLVLEIGDVTRDYYGSDAARVDAAIHATERAINDIHAVQTALYALRSNVAQK